MTNRYLAVRLALGAGALFSVNAQALGQTYYAHFQKQTPASYPLRYALPGVEADLDGNGYGDPSTHTLACSTDKTNPDPVRVVLTDDDDEMPWGASAPGGVQTIAHAYRVTFRVDAVQSTATYGCDYEIFYHPTGGPTTAPVSLNGSGEFSIVIPANSNTNSRRRAIETRFLSDPSSLDTGPDPESIVLRIVGVAFVGTPPSSPTLAVGANDRLVWLLENNANPAPVTSPGDECSAAQVISGAGVYFFNTSAATPSAVPVACGGSSTKDVWFRWSTPFSATFFLDTYQTRSKSVVEVYTGTCAGLTSIACNDGPSEQLSGSGVQIAATAGTTYYVRVGGVGAGGYGALTVKDLRPGLAPFVQLGHTTIATRKADSQVSTKVVKRFSPVNSDYFGIRFMDGNLNTFGNIDGVQIPAGIDLRISASLLASPGAGYALYSDVGLTTPVTVTGSTFTLDALYPSLGIAIFGAFPTGTATGAVYDVGFRFDSVALIPPAVGDLPRVGWNSRGKWLVIN